MKLPLSLLLLFSLNLALNAEEVDQALEKLDGFSAEENRDALRELEAATVAVLDQRSLLENKLLDALDSAPNREAKSFLFRQLRTVATKKAIPRIEPFLHDPEMSHMARFVLGRIPGDEATVALRKALSKAQGSLRAGLYETLGNRRDAMILDELAQDLEGSDAQLITASAQALGKIGNAKAAEYLMQARTSASPRVRPSINNALLRCAEVAQAEERHEDASELYRYFLKSSFPIHLRVSGLRGLAQGEGSGREELLKAALNDSDPQFRGTAVQLMADSEEGLERLQGHLAELSSSNQELAIRALVEKGMVDSVADIRELAGESKEANVRLASLQALGSLGDASSTHFLVMAAAAEEGSLQNAARASLGQLPKGETDELLLSGLESTCQELEKAGENRERVRALASRQVSRAFSPILQTAESPDKSLRQESIRALGFLGKPDDVSSLTRLLANANHEDDRRAIESSITQIFRQMPQGDDRAEPLLKAFERTQRAQHSLLSLLSKTGSNEALTKIRELRTANELSQSATQSLTQWPTAEAMDDLLAIAQFGGEQEGRLALRGVARLAGASKDPVKHFTEAMVLAKSLDDKKMVLGALGKTKSEKTLGLALSQLEKEGLESEAGAAAIQISRRLRQSHPKLVRASLEKVLAELENEALQDQAKQILERMK